jgi:hypothetical protein
MPAINGFLGPSYNGRSSEFLAARTVNLFAELGTVDGTSKTIISLVGPIGSAFYANGGASPVRGMYPWNGSLYVVEGSTLSRFTANLQQIILGTLTTSVGRVLMKDNGLTASGIGGNQLMIIDGANGYIVDTSDTFSIISDGVFPANPIALGYIDGYFVVAAQGSMAAYCSTIYNGLSGYWPFLAVSPIQAEPDIIRVIQNLNQQLWFIKQYTSEIWYDAGISTVLGFPFSRTSAGIINCGTPSPFGVVRADNSLAFPATQWNNDQGEFIGIVELSGSSPVVISPQPITYQMSKWAPWTDVFGFSFSLEGHTFGIWTSPSANQTFMYDFTTQMWFEWSSWTGSPYITGRHFSNCYAYFNGMHLVGDYASGNINYLSTSLYQDSGNPIASLRVGPPIFDSNNLDNVMIESFELDAEMGVGNPTTSLNPQIALSYSDDGGHRWSTEMLRGLGAAGQYQNRAIWNNLGSFAQFLPRVAITDNCSRVLTGAYVR